RNVTPVAPERTLWPRHSSRWLWRQVCFRLSGFSGWFCARWFVYGGLGGEDPDIGLRARLGNGCGQLHSRKWHRRLRLRRWLLHGMSWCCHGMSRRFLEKRERGSVIYRPVRLRLERRRLRGDPNPWPQRDLRNRARAWFVSKIKF